MKPRIPMLMGKIVAITNIATRAIRGTISMEFMVVLSLAVRQGRLPGRVLFLSKELTGLATSVRHLRCRATGSGFACHILSSIMAYITLETTVLQNNVEFLSGGLVQLKSACLAGRGAGLPVVVGARTLRVSSTFKSPLRDVDTFVIVLKPAVAQACAVTAGDSVPLPDQSLR